MTSIEKLLKEVEELKTCHWEHVRLTNELIKMLKEGTVWLSGESVNADPSWELMYKRALRIITRQREYIDKLENMMLGGKR